ncbi:MAG: nuclear transport factor 2 family protein [Gammaproteobacteria bacterium]|nr:nuclear transport factor 2 family protein [Gammaproteobacteria bacterium]MCP4089272.1 nuclear transport factor 2 family protein [Gammaproteobacteria bacterium]MCP4275304.1 nuclear transport factor 2 family protein [Gammaproteobacteria bacterium]MCP4830912.1 nuclear transport factor 2 family protein [Gammaproteobacteria bacterium]MCP4930281.1 nuclear transport factor 2 family protein [Gammaproteobacteria bacterium]
MSDLNLGRNLKRYTDFFEQLNADNLGQITSVMTEDVHFVDPFNDVNGIESVEKIFKHMFSTLQNPKFKVTHAALDNDSHACGLISWELRSTLHGKPYKIIGMSEVSFAADGRVKAHIDHWDAARQFYEKLPIIGWLLKTIRVRLSV